MEFVSEVGELQGNQGMDGEENVMAVEPITMIVPPELQDVPETPTAEGSASSGAHEDSGANPSPSPEGSSTENTASASSTPPESMEVAVNIPPVAGWENKTISGRLSNLRKAPNTLTAGFRFRASLHHEVADCPTSIKGYKRLEEVVRRYHVPRTVLLRTGTTNERACSVSATGWIPVYVDHFDAGLRFPLPGLIFDILSEYELSLTQFTPNSIKFIVGFMLLCARLQIPAKAIVFRSLFLCRLSSAQTRCEQAARIQNRELADTCKRLSSDKASLEDEVNRLQSSEMANRAASAESRADELANKVIQLQEELDKAKAEKESGIQAAMDEVVRAVDLRKKVEAERDGALGDLNAIRGRVAVADQDLARAEESLRQAKAQHQRCISIARAQGAEWLVGADMFQDAVAVASMNTTTEIYNDVRGKVLKHRPDFPINELAFFDGEEFDAEGKSLVEPSDTTVRLRWELNEEGLPIWPPSVLEEGEEYENLLRFDTWAGDAPVEEAEPSSTPPALQPTPAAISIPARADASAPVDLTDD
ncbi:hypothetical protein SLEP1_g36435 [Rubroshorea leprosula]|uniref:Transposase (putative) gypsy type domain-containing protein n=1 Tax=Rubroshorea leprosula TaxID=152421 RepID=A0AAV5KRN0_9ROSI|nr:hypothetical protein SLEP1_g36435 [Rubroshorea leprosula]